MEENATREAEWARRGGRAGRGETCHLHGAPPWFASTPHHLVGRARESHSPPAPPPARAQTARAQHADDSTTERDTAVRARAPRTHCRAGSWGLREVHRCSWHRAQDGLALRSTRRPRMRHCEIAAHRVRGLCDRPRLGYRCRALHRMRRLQKAAQVRYVWRHQERHEERRKNYFSAKGH